MTDGIDPLPGCFPRASRGPRADAEGLLDSPAGDLVMAWYAVGVDGEQDSHAVPGAGGDLGRGSAGGQPQRQRRVPQIVGAQYPVDGVLGWAGCCGAGLVPDPAVEAFAERAAAGTAGQPPVWRGAVCPQVPAEEGD
jgi:hypothetical protein